MQPYRQNRKLEELLSAAERKIYIAQFHYQNLKNLENDKSTEYPKHHGMPSIEIQAYFEGVIIAASSAIDKLLKALKSQFSNENINNSTLDLLKPLEQYIPIIGPLIKKESFYHDLQKIRNYAIHEVHIKTPDGPPDSKWMIRKPWGSDYTGERTILEYAKTACQFAEDCKPVAEKIRSLL